MHYLFCLGNKWSLQHSWIEIKTQLCMNFVYMYLCVSLSCFQVEIMIGFKTQHQQVCSLHVVEFKVLLEKCISGFKCAYFLAIWLGYDNQFSNCLHKINSCFTMSWISIKISGKILLKHSPCTISETKFRYAIVTDPFYIC